ncbi:MAG: putative bifunctional diguanylate cyclase/phosphodiesterase [Elainellaceae cyanobacterium]
MTQYKGDILIVDDTPDNLRVLSTLLTEKQYKVRSVISGRLALTVAQQAQPDLILLDIKMPEIGGYEVCEYLKLNDATADIPVIFLSALDAPIDKVNAFSVGGVDFITKPFNPEEVLVRIDTQLRLRNATRELQAINAELEDRVRQRTVQLEREISERRRVQEELLHQALHDSLTGLPNRALLMKRLGLILANAREHKDFKFAVFFLDCDRFKLVNDSLGHSTGDKMLVAVAGRIGACLPPGSMLARLGGDEFIALIENIPGPEETFKVAEAIQREIKRPFQLEQYEFFTSISIGIVIGDQTYSKPEHVLRDSDTAMYEAKAAGKGCYSLFVPHLNQLAQSQFNLEGELRRALENDELVLTFQAIVDMEADQIYGFEALVRWQHPERGLLKPDNFIALAEESETIELIDFWVLKKVCQNIAAWQLKGLLKEPMRISVNFSTRHFSNADFITKVDQVLNQYGIERKFLSIEITEHSLMAQAEAAARILTQLQQRDIQVCIDDFGTGYSSLSYLHQYPINALKIDRRFVQNLHNQPQNTAIIQAIVALADALGVHTIAEGVEIAPERDKLLELGNHLAQGHLFSAPVGEAAVETFLIEGIGVSR